MLNTLESLFNLARERKKSPIAGSYTNKLLSNKTLSKEKVLEEVKELIEAVENNSNKVGLAAIFQLNKMDKISTSFLPSSASFSCNFKSSESSISL